MVIWRKTLENVHRVIAAHDAMNISMVTQNTSLDVFCWDDFAETRSHHAQAQKIFLLTISPVISLLNLICMNALWNTKDGRSLTSMNKIFFMLSLSDFFVGTFLCPVHAFRISVNDADCHIVQPRLMYANVYFDGFGYLSVCLTVCIAAERYINIVNSTHRNKLITVLFFSCALFLSSWFANAVCFRGKQCGVAYSHPTNVMISLLSGIMIFLWIFIFNTKLLMYALKQYRDNDMVLGQLQNERSLTITVVMINVSLLLCYTPMIIITILHGIARFTKSDRIQVTLMAQYWSQCIFQMNSGINSAIFMLSVRKVRVYNKRLLVVARDNIYRRMRMVLQRNVVDIVVNDV